MTEEEDEIAFRKKEMRCLVCYVKMKLKIHPDMDYETIVMEWIERYAKIFREKHSEGS